MKFTLTLGSVQINTSLNINELVFVTNCYANNTCVRIYNYIYFEIKYMTINIKNPFHNKVSKSIKTHATVLLN